MSWLPRLLARSIRASSSSHARTTSAPAPVSPRGGAGECPRFPVIDPLDRDVAPDARDDPDADRDPAVEDDDTRLGLRLCAVPGRAPGAANTSGCCGFMYRYGNGASPAPASSRLSLPPGVTSTGPPSTSSGWALTSRESAPSWRPWTPPLPPPLLLPPPARRPPLPPRPPTPLKSPAAAR